MESLLDYTNVFKCQWDKKKRKYKSALENKGEIVFFRCDYFMSTCEGTKGSMAKLRFITESGEKVKAKSFAYAVYKSAEKYFQAMYPEYKRFYPDSSWSVYSVETFLTNQIVTGKLRKASIEKLIKPLEVYLEPEICNNHGDPYYTGKVSLQFKVKHEIVFSCLPISKVVAEPIYYEVIWNSVKKQELVALPLDMKPDWWNEDCDPVGFTSIEHLLTERMYWENVERLKLIKKAKAKRDRKLNKKNK